IWASPAGELYLVARLSLVSNASGQWVEQELLEGDLGSGPKATSVHGGPDGSVFAGGTTIFSSIFSGSASFATIFEYDDGWSQPVYLPTGGQQFTEVAGVWNGGASDRIAVGKSVVPEPEGGRIWEFDGTDWTPLPRYAVAGGFLAVHGTIDGALVVAVGANALLRREAGVWQSLETRGTSLSSVWVAPNQDLFVGDEAGVVHAFIDDAWTAMSLPVNDDVRAVFGRSSTDVFAVAGGLLYHFDGAGWTEVEGDYDQLTTGYADGGEVLAGARHLSVYQALDDRWQLVGDANVAPRGYCVGAGDAIFSVNAGKVRRFSGGTLQQWEQPLTFATTDTAAASSTELILTRRFLTSPNLAVFSNGVLTQLYQATFAYVGAGVAAKSIDDIAWAMACSSNCTNNPAGQLHVFDGSDWTVVDFPLQADELPVDLIVAQGDYHLLTSIGRILRFSVGEFTEVAQAPTDAAVVLWEAEGQWWVGSSDGSIHHFVDPEWQSTVLSSVPIRSIAGTSASDVVAVTVNEGFHYDGSLWAEFRVPAAGSFEVCATSDIFAALTDGRLGWLRRIAPW
ncbi:MAG: hypothetical protein KJO07_06020, partial [Deltaproteobacteria bacterium]|nr:hypothetical protein [Deltaproteobacteria bacterium]